MESLHRHLRACSAPFFLSLGLVAAGCLSDEARDLNEFLNDPEYLASLADAGSGNDGPESCSDVSNGAPLHVRFENHSTAPLTLFWVMPSCSEQSTAQLEPAGGFDVDSFVGQVWLVRDLGGAKVFEVRLSDMTPAVVEVAK